MTTRKPSGVDALIALARRTDAMLSKQLKHGYDIAREVYRLHQAAEGLDKLAQHRAPASSASQHAKNIATAAQALSDAIATSRAKIAEISRRGEAELQADIERQIKLQPDGYATQTLRHFDRLPPSERHKLLEQFIAEGDHSSLAAVLRAPRHLSGITAEQKQNYLNAVIAKHAPEEAGNLRELAAMRETGESACEAAASVAAHFSDNETLSKLVADEREAEAAARQFVDALAKGDDK